MNQLTEDRVRAIAAEMADPETGRKLGSTGQLLAVKLSASQADVEVGLTTHSAPLYESFCRQVQSELQQQLPQLKGVHVHHRSFGRKPSALGQIGLTAKSVIAVGSGKGGVGKSTVAACLALTLKKMGCKVGLMDADVYGPSIPQLIGAQGQPEQVDNKIQPIDCQGMPVMSIGFMVPVEQAVIWRGPMLHSAVTQFLRDTSWGELDYLIIDMPPGTGDVALTLSQLLPLTGSIVVCTPQKVALLDAIKATAMFQKVRIPVLGVVENMSTFICPDTGNRYDIFGSGGARRFAEQAGIAFLGELPINIALRQRGDEGSTLENLEDPAVEPYLTALARGLAAQLAQRAAQNPVVPQLPVLQ